MYISTTKTFAEIVNVSDITVVCCSVIGDSFYEGLNHIKEVHASAWEQYQANAKAGKLKVGTSKFIQDRVTRKCFIFVPVHYKYHMSGKAEFLEAGLADIAAKYHQGFYKPFKRGDKQSFGVVMTGVVKHAHIPWQVAGKLIAEWDLSLMAHENTDLHVGVWREQRWAVFPVLATLPDAEAEANAADVKVEDQPAKVDPFARLKEYWITLSVQEREALRLQYVALCDKEDEEYPDEYAKEVEPAKAPSKAPTVKHEEPKFAPGVAPKASKPARGQVANHAWPQQWAKPGSVMANLPQVLEPEAIAEMRAEGVVDNQTIVLDDEDMSTIDRLNAEYHAKYGAEIAEEDMAAIDAANATSDAQHTKVNPYTLAVAK